LTVEDLEQNSASNTPRRSRSLTPVETPLTGTVGSYWIHTGRVVESDSGSSSKGMLRTKKVEVILNRCSWLCILIVFMKQ
jgi:hypothetical protein